MPKWNHVIDDDDVMLVPFEKIKRGQRKQDEDDKKKKKAEKHRQSSE